MTVTRKLVFVWMLALFGSLLLPSVSGAIAVLDAGADGK